MKAQTKITRLKKPTYRQLLDQYKKLNESHERLLVFAEKYKEAHEHLDKSNIPTFNEKEIELSLPERIKYIFPEHLDVELYLTSRGIPKTDVNGNRLRLVDRIVLFGQRCSDAGKKLGKQEVSLFQRLKNAWRAVVVSKP